MRFCFRSVYMYFNLNSGFASESKHNCHVAIVGSECTITCESKDQKYPMKLCGPEKEVSVCEVDPDKICKNTTSIEGSWNGSIAEFKLRNLTYFEKGVYMCQEGTMSFPTIDILVISELFPISHINYSKLIWLVILYWKRHPCFFSTETLSDTGYQLEVCPYWFWDKAMSP